MENFQLVLEMMYVVKSVYDHGRYDELLNRFGDYEYDPDYIWEIFFESANSVFSSEWQMDVEI